LTPAGGRVEIAGLCPRRDSCCGDNDPQRAPAATKTQPRGGGGDAARGVEFGKVGHFVAEDGRPKRRTFADNDRREVTIKYRYSRLVHGELWGIGTARRPVRSIGSDGKCWTGKHVKPRVRSLRHSGRPPRSRPWAHEETPRLEGNLHGLDSRPRCLLAEVAKRQGRNRGAIGPGQGRDEMVPLTGGQLPHGPGEARMQRNLRYGKGLSRPRLLIGSELKR